MSSGKGGGRRKLSTLTEMTPAMFGWLKRHVTTRSCKAKTSRPNLSSPGECTTCEQASSIIGRVFLHHGGYPGCCAGGNLDCSMIRNPARSTAPASHSQPVKKSFRIQVALIGMRGAAWTSLAVGDAKQPA